MTAVRKLEIRVDQTGSAKKGLKGLAGGLKGIAVPAGVAVAAIAAVGAAAIGVGAKLISMGSDAEEMKGKFDVVFGKFGPDAIVALDEFGNAIGRSKFELMGMAASTQDLLVPMGFMRGDAAALSVDLTKLAVDVASFNNATDADVQRDFNAAMTGSHETVKKYGIILNDTTLHQELLRMGVVKGMKGATEQEKVQGRLNLIYAGTADAQGDAARTSGSWANQMRALTSTLSEAATTMGVELLPIVTPLLAEFTVWIVDIMPKAVEIFKVFAANFRENVLPAMVLIKDAIDRISVAFGIETEAVSAADVILWVFEKTLGVIVTTMQIVAIGAQNVAWAIETIKAPIDRIIAAFNALKAAASSALNGLPDWIKPGSPTPFEIGLRGIADAAKRVNLEIGGMGMAPMTGGGAIGGGGGGGITVNLTYSPAVSLANRTEAQEKLGPYIAEYLRKEGY